MGKGQVGEEVETLMPLGTVVAPGACQLRQPLRAAMAAMGRGTRNLERRGDSVSCNSNSYAVLADCGASTNGSSSSAGGGAGGLAMVPVEAKDLTQQVCLLAFWSMATCDTWIPWIASRDKGSSKSYFVG